jgi:galactokinase
VSGGHEDVLRAAGLSAPQAEAKARLFDAAERAWATWQGSSPSPPAAHFVPGRIEVLGKHTDYAGGASLLCAAEVGFCVLSAARQDATVRVLDAATGENMTTALDPAAAPNALSWSRYPATVARRLARNFPNARRGVDMVLVSDLPAASGMSSSSAFMIAVYLAIAEVNRLPEHPAFRREIRDQEDLAGYLAVVENGASFGQLEGDTGVGTFGGSEDHTSILCCRAGSLSHYSFCPVRHIRTMPLDAAWSFVVAMSGVVAEKTGAAREKYNRASASVARMLEIWRDATGGREAVLASLTSSPATLDRLRGLIRASRDPRFAPSLLSDRLEQFVEESAILAEAASLFESGEIDRLGTLVARSQAAAERLLGNQVPETVDLVQAAVRLGAAAASAFGAGFGGSVWALVSSAQAEGFKEAWASDYAAKYPHRAPKARFLVTRPGPAALRLPPRTRALGC